MSMLYETIDPFEFIMVEKSSDHVRLLEENKTLKKSIMLWLATIVVVGVGSVIYFHNKSDSYNK